MSDFQAQYIISSYSKQLINPSRGSENPNNKEEALISPDGKKELLINRITIDILRELTSEGDLSQRAKNIIDQLSQECGRSVEIWDDKKGMRFRFVDKVNGKTIFPSPRENVYLHERLIEIIRSKIKAL